MSGLALGESDLTVIDIDYASDVDDSVSLAPSSTGNGKKLKIDMGSAIIGLGEAMKEGLMALKPADNDNSQAILQELRALNESQKEQSKALSESQKQQSLINLEILKALQNLKE